MTSLLTALLFLAVSSMAALSAKGRGRPLKADIYFVRHGETTANRDGILQGHCDFPLTEKGASQAALVGKALRHTKWSKVYSSDLKRASDTAEIISSLSNTGQSFTNIFTKSPVLREVSFGVREMLPRGTTVEEAIEIVAKRDSIAPEFVVDTAEDEDQILDRQRSLMHVLYQTACSIEDAGSMAEVDAPTLSPVSPTDSELTSLEVPANAHRPLILCVSHGGFIRRFLKNFCGITNIEKIGNCSISVVHVDFSSAEEYKVYADEDRINCMDHITLDPNFAEAGETADAEFADVR